LIGALGHCYALQGKRIEAEAACDELADLSKTRYVSPFNTALIHLGLNDVTQALQWLERALAMRSYELVWLKVDPRWDALRLLPRFVTVVETVGLGPAA
jgi:hypothetical protein